MKFRSRILDIACIQQFIKIVSTISKLAKVVAVRFTPDAMYFIVNDEIVNGGGCIWAEVPQESLFHEYSMAGVSEEFNEIYLEVSISLMVNALKSAQAAKSLKMKLVKKQTPCLIFEVELPSATSNVRTAWQEVPVSVVPRRMWTNLAEPDIGDFDIEILLPSLKMMKNIVDKMKNLSTYATLSASPRGEMSLFVEADLVTVTTHFPALQVSSSASGEVTRGGNFEVRIDLRRLASLLTGQQLNPSQVMCKIAHKRLSHFHFCHEYGSLQYFLPCVQS